MDHRRQRKRERDNQSKESRLITCGTWNLCLKGPGHDETLDHVTALMEDWGIMILALQECNLADTLPQPGYTMRTHSDFPFVGFAINDVFACPEPILTQNDIALLPLPEWDLVVVSFRAPPCTHIHNDEERANFFQTLSKAINDVGLKHVLAFCDGNAHIALHDLLNAGHPAACLQGEESLYPKKTDVNGFGLLALATEFQLALANFTSEGSHRSRITFKGVPPIGCSIIDWILTPTLMYAGPASIRVITPRRPHSDHKLVIIKTTFVKHNTDVMPRGKPTLPPIMATRRADIELERILVKIKEVRATQKLDAVKPPQARIGAATKGAFEALRVLKKTLRVMQRGVPVDITSIQRDITLAARAAYALRRNDARASTAAWISRIEENRKCLGPNGQTALWQAISAMKNGRRHRYTFIASKAKIDMVKHFKVIIGSDHPIGPIQLPPIHPPKPATRPPRPTTWITITTDGAYHEGRMGYAFHVHETGVTVCSSSNFWGSPRYTPSKKLAETMGHAMAMAAFPPQPGVGLRIRTDTSSRIREFNEAVANGMHSIPDILYSYIVQRMVSSTQIRATELILIEDRKTDEHLARAHRAAKFARNRMWNTTQFGGNASCNIRMGDETQWWLLHDDEALFKLNLWNPLETFTRLCAPWYHELQPPSSMEANDNTPENIELAEIIGRQKKGRASGPDGTKAEHAQALGADSMKPLFDAIWEDECIPEKLRAFLLALIPKKPGALVPNNARGIALVCVPVKILSTIGHRRNRNNEVQKMQQAFRKGGSCGLGILVLQHMIHDSRACRKGLVITFVDQKAAYDSIPRELMEKVMSLYGWGPKICSIFASVYKDICQIRYPNGEYAEPFPGDTGVKQGMPDAGAVFGCFMDLVFRNAIPRMSGVQFTQFIMNCIVTAFLIAFADDIAVVATCTAAMQTDMDIFAEECLKFNLRVNIPKSEVMIVVPEADAGPFIAIAESNRDKRTVYNTRLMEAGIHLHQHTDAIWARITIAPTHRTVLMPWGSTKILCPYMSCYYVATTDKQASPQDLLSRHLEKDHGWAPTRGGKIGSRKATGADRRQMLHPNASELITRRKIFDYSPRAVDPMARSTESNEARERALAALVAGPKAMVRPITVIDTLDVKEPNKRKPLAYVGIYKYLGRLITRDGSLVQEIVARTQAAQGAFAGLRKVWMAKTMNLRERVQLYFSFVVSVLLNSAETWAPSNTEVRQIARPYHRHLREICGLQCRKNANGGWDTPGSVERVRRLCRVPDIMDLVREKQLRIAGSVYRRRTIHGELAVFLWATRSTDAPRIRGGQRKTWMHVVEDHLRDVGLVWEDAYDLEKWHAKSRAKIPPKLAPHDEHEEDLGLARDNEILDVWRNEEARITAELRDDVASDDSAEEYPNDSSWE